MSAEKFPTDEKKQKKKEYDKEYRRKNKDKINQYRSDNKEDIAFNRIEQCKIYYQENKSEILKKNKIYRDNHSEERSIQRKTWRIQNLKQARDLDKEDYNKNKEAHLIRSKKYSKTIKGKYNQYKNSATQRKIEFGLSLIEFESFWNLSCSYCGNDIETIGIDRIDNELGYTLDNCCSCCYRCNIAKMNFNLDNILNHITKIIKFQRSPFNYNHRNKPKYGNLFYRYSTKAKERNLDFSISKEDFDKLLHSTCGYCGNDSNIGIDRIDSSKGYMWYHVANIAIG